MTVPSVYLLQQLQLSAKCYDGAPDGSGNATGNEVAISTTIVWTSDPPEAFLITSTGKESATAVARDAKVKAVTLTATEPTSGKSKAVSVQVLPLELSILSLAVQVAGP